MVDLDNLTSISNSGKFPNLLNSADVDAVKQIIEVYPDLFADDYNNGCGIRKSSNVTKYGFRKPVPTGVSQYQYFDGSIGESKLFPYLQNFKFLYFENSVMVEEVLSFEPIPLFAPTIESICQLALETTGNNNLLRGLLDILDNVDGDYEVTTINISKINKHMKIGLVKSPTSRMSDEVYKYLGTRSNTKIYQSCSGLVNRIEDYIYDGSEVYLPEMVIECNENGLLKQLGYSLSTHFMKDAPEGTSPNDNITLWTERHESHNASVAGIASIADWTEELSTWEQNPNAVFGATIMTATADGISNEYIYGLG